MVVKETIQDQIGILERCVLKREENKRKSPRARGEPGLPHRTFFDLSHIPPPGFDKWASKFFCGAGLFWLRPAIQKSS